MKKLKICTALLALISTSSFAEVYDSNFSIGVRGQIQRNDFSFDTPIGHSILKWQDMKGNGYGLDLGYKFNDNIDGFLNYTMTKSNSGNGTDDDISNYGKGFSVHKAKGETKDYKIGLNINAYKGKGLNLSPRIGYFHKSALLQLYGGQYFYGDTSYGDNENAITQQTKSTFQGAVLGFKVDKQSSPEVINSLIFDFYPMVRYKGNQLWPYQTPGNGLLWSLKSVGGKGALSRNMGMMVQLEHKFRLQGSLWMKIYTYYEHIQVQKLKEKADYGDTNTLSIAKGKAEWDSVGLGVGLYF